MRNWKIMRVADFIAKRLQFLGLNDAFMVTGGAAMHLNDAFAKHFSTHVHCLHHEQAPVLDDSLPF